MEGAKHRDEEPAMAAPRAAYARRRAITVAVLSRRTLAGAAGITRRPSTPGDLDVPWRIREDRRTRGRIYVMVYFSDSNTSFCSRNTSIEYVKSPTNFPRR